MNRAAFKTKLSIVDSVARHSVVRCTLGIPTNDLHIFFLLSYPFSCTFACDTRIATLWSCTVHDRNSRLLSVERTTIVSTWLRIPWPFSITVSRFMVHETRESILSRLVYGGILPCHAFISFSTLESRKFHPVRNRCNGDSFSLLIYLFLFVMLVSYTFSCFFRYYFIMQNDDISLFNSRVRVTFEHRQVTISNTFFYTNVVSWTRALGLKELKTRG